MKTKDPLDCGECDPRDDCHECLKLAYKDLESELKRCTQLSNEESVALGIANAGWRFEEQKNSVLEAKLKRQTDLLKRAKSVLSALEYAEHLQILKDLGEE